MYRFVSAIALAAAVLFAGCSADNGSPNTNGSGNGTADADSPPVDPKVAHDEAHGKLYELKVEVLFPGPGKVPEEDVRKVMRVDFVAECTADDKHLALLKRLQWIEREGFPRTLHIHSSRISDQGLAHLADFTLLNGEVNLSGSERITDAGLKYLSGLECNTLVLRNMKITDAGLANLRGAKTLTLLLEGSRVTEDGVPYLRGIRDLRQVQFDERQISAEGLERAKKMLPDVEVIRSPVKAE